MTAEKRRLALSWEQACTQTAADAAKLASRMRADHARARLGLHLEPIPGTRWWQRGLKWSVQDDTTGTVLASGRAWSRRAAERRRYRAYLRVLTEVA